MQLETKRLLLRRPTVQDVDDYMEFVNSDFVMRYNAMSPVTCEKAAARFSDGRDNESLALILKETGKMIGMVCIEEDSLRYGVASREFSYFLREEEARKGYMSEALHALIGHLFETEDLYCVAARCFAPNIASQKLLESLGFHRDGLVRNCVRGHGGIVFDDMLYSLTREEYVR